MLVAVDRRLHQPLLRDAQVPSVRGPGRARALEVPRLRLPVRQLSPANLFDAAAGDRRDRRARPLRALDRGLDGRYCATPSASPPSRRASWSPRRTSSIARSGSGRRASASCTGGRSTPCARSCSRPTTGSLKVDRRDEEERMKRRRLGDSDLEVSEISLGSWLTYSGGVEREHTEACTRAAFDAEHQLLRHRQRLRHRRRGGGVGRDPLRLRPRARSCSRPRSTSRCRTPTPGSRAEQITKQIDASLARLQTDYVDLYQCHRFDPESPIEETMEALTEVVEVGQGALPRLQRVDARADPRRARRARERRSSSPPSRSTT